jgi:hypothetical protein
MKIFIAHSSSYDFRNELYIPIRKSSLNNDHEIILPQEKGKEVITKDIIKNQDLIIAEVSHASTGQGIELGWANIFDTPILCVYRKGSKPSNSLKFITDNFIEYSDPKDLVNKLDEYFRRAVV